MCFWPSPIRRAVVEAPLDTLNLQLQKAPSIFFITRYWPHLGQPTTRASLRWRRELHHFADADRANPLAAPGSDR